jgi:hypothetical protein
VSTDVVPVEPMPRETALLFNGAGPEEVLDLAGAAATRFADVVKKQRLSQRISGRDHVLIEGWQTLGSLVGVFAVKDIGVTEIPWPKVAKLWEEPARPGPEPKRASADYPAWEHAVEERQRWEHHRDLLRARDGGLAYGYAASFRAITRDGDEIGWGEGMSTRNEPHKELDDEHSHRSMAQTRGQSRTLSAPLRWLVKLAGYATTPAEEMPDAADERVAELERQLAEERAHQLAAVLPVLDDAALRQVMTELQQRYPSIDAFGYMERLAKRFTDGIPEPVGVALRAWAWWVGQPAATGSFAAQEAADAAAEGPAADPAEAPGADS